MTLCVLILFWGASLHGSAFNECACSRDALRKHGDQQITLISVYEQPGVEFLHAEVDVILFTAEQMDSNDVTRHDSG